MTFWLRLWFRATVDWTVKILRLRNSFSELVIICLFGTTKRLLYKYEYLCINMLVKAALVVVLCVGSTYMDRSAINCRVSYGVCPSVGTNRREVILKNIEHAIDEGNCVFPSISAYFEPLRIAHQIARTISLNSLSYVQTLKTILLLLT